MTQTAKIILWVSIGVVVALVAILAIVFRDQLFTLSAGNELKAQQLEEQIVSKTYDLQQLQLEIRQLETQYSTSRCPEIESDAVVAREDAENCARLKAQIEEKQKQEAALFNEIGALQRELDALLAEGEATGSTATGIVATPTPTSVAIADGTISTSVGTTFDPSVLQQQTVCTDGFKLNAETNQCDAVCSADENEIVVDGRVALCCPKDQVYDAETGVCSPPDAGTSTGSTSVGGTIGGIFQPGANTGTIADGQLGSLNTGTVTLDPNVVNIPQCAEGYLYNASINSCDLQCFPKEKPVRGGEDGQINRCDAACVDGEVYQGDDSNGQPICTTPGTGTSTSEIPGATTPLPNGLTCPEGQVPDTSSEIAVCKNVCPSGTVYKGLDAVENPICTAIPVTTVTPSGSGTTTTQSGGTSTTTPAKTVAKTGAETPLLALLVVAILAGGGFVARKLSRG